MNNTTKAKYELATKMLKGRIDTSEVVLMSGLPLEEVLKIKESIEPNSSDAEILKNLDSVDLNIGEILFDNLPAENEDLEGFHQ